jgi:hypothetical protein
MSKQCYRLWGQQPGLSPFDVNQCWASIRVETRAAGSHGGTLYYITQSVDGGPEIVSGDCSIANFSLESCGKCAGCCTDPVGISSAQSYDCINGGCVPKTTYNTPGVFATLAACESGCAKNSNCTGECVSTSELAALAQAANTLQSKNCK